MKKILILIAAFYLIGSNICLAANYYQTSNLWSNTTSWSTSSSLIIRPSTPPGTSDIVTLYPDKYGVMNVSSSVTILGLNIIFGYNVNFAGNLISNGSNLPFIVTGATNITMTSTSSILTVNAAFYSSGAATFAFNTFDLQFPIKNGNSLVCKFLAPTVTFSGNVTTSSSGAASNILSYLTMDFLAGTTVSTNGSANCTIGSSTALAANVNPASTWSFILESAVSPANTILNTTLTNTFGSLPPIYKNYINFGNTSTRVNYIASSDQSIYTTSTPNLTGASSSTSFRYNAIKIANTTGVATVIGGTLITINGFTNATTNSSTNYIDFTTNATTLNLIGTIQTVQTTSTGNPTKFYNLTINTSTSTTFKGSAGFAVASQGVVALNSGGSFGCTSMFTLLSDVNGSASIAPVLNGGTINGNFTVQRYLSGSSSGVNYRGYRLLSSAVNVGNLFHNYDNLTHCNGATFITGPGGSANGFDQDGNSTIYFFDDAPAPSDATFTSGNWYGVTNLSTPYNSAFSTSGDSGYDYNYSGNGYLLFYRGSRSTGNPYNPASLALPSTLNDVGVPNFGNVTVVKFNNGNNQYLEYTNDTTTNAAVRGFNLLGNPYACTIDWNTSTSGGINLTNVSNTIYTLNVNGTYGTYQWDGTTGTATNNGSRYIASGQGFFVQATAAAPTFTFTENAKTLPSGFNPVQGATTAGTQLGTILPTANQHLILSLIKDTINYEDSFIGFNKNASPKLVPNEDARYLNGSSKVHLATLSSDNAKLAINRQPLPTSDITSIPLIVTATSDGTYQLNLKEFSGIPSIYQVYLKDNYLKDSVNLRMHPNYTFSISNSDKFSYGTKRFVLLIKEDTSLMVKLKTFKAKPNFTKMVSVNWETLNEFNYTRFAVERSVDQGKTYITIDSLISSNAGNYNFTDQQPINGTMLYRLKMTDLNGYISYSTPVKISYNSDVLQTAIIVYPNPAANQITIALNNSAGQQLTKGYTIKIFNEAGIEVLSATSAINSWQGNVSKLHVGTYMIQVFDNKAFSPVGNGKFVKQ